ncbi:hypothetical protein [Aeromonas veronii]|uniref:hypothetical protein n=1 Tax=Aeromonas veronii TaxID=654 RepID=UPI0029D91801|nr:hypothetical protein [Aeromonas veronii]MDX7875425.1 hypothetical protein [Aeromonas veronii]
MYWPDTGTGVDTEPARKPVASAVRKYFTEGGVGVPPTVPGGDWFNAITNEVLNVLDAAGIDPSKTDDDQLVEAISFIASESSSSLQAKLAEYDGAGLVGGALYDQIRSYEGDAEYIKCLGRSNIFDEAHGNFFLDPTDTSSADDDGIVIVDALGRRWKRQYSGAVNVRWFGATPSNDTAPVAIQNRDAFRKATLSMKSAWDAWKTGKRSRSVYVPGGDYNLSNGFCVPKGCSIFSDGLGVARLKILGATADAANKLPLVSMGRVIDDATLVTEVTTGAYVNAPPPFIDQLYLNPQNSNTALDVTGIPGFAIGTVWLQADKGLKITGGSGDGVVGTIFAEDSTGFGVEIGDCQNLTIETLYSFLCKNPLVYSGDSNNTIVKSLQANYTKVAPIATLDGANVRGAKIGVCNVKQNVQYGTFKSVLQLRSDSCDLSIGEMDARNYNGYAVNNETGLSNSVHIGLLRLRQTPFAITDTAGVGAKGCRVNNLSLTVDEVDIAELGFSPFEVVGTFASTLKVDGGRVGGLNATVPICDISNTSSSSKVELQVEPPTGLALFNLQSVISPIYDRVRRPFPIVIEGGRQAVKIPFAGNANSWRVSITANSNPAGNAAYRRVRRLFVAQETGFNSVPVSNLAAVDDGNTGLTVSFSPDISYQLDFGSVGNGAQMAFSASGYAVISVPSSYASLTMSIEQMR